MISRDKLLQTLQALLDQAVPKNINIDNISNQLTALEQSNNIQLSEYGYVMYVLENAGLGGIYHGRLSDPMLMKGYVDAAIKMRDDLPGLLVNAKEYAEKVFNVILDPELCMPRLEGMSFPYVLFILFTATGNWEMVEQYTIETKELLTRYPSTLDKLPESFQQATQEALANADSE